MGGWLLVEFVKIMTRIAVVVVVVVVKFDCAMCAIIEWQ